MTMRKRVAARSSLGVATRACPAPREAALVVVTNINLELEKIPPAIGPTEQA
jgi:hypothetical protein